MPHLFVKMLFCVLFCQSDVCELTLDQITAQKPETVRVQQLFVLLPLVFPCFFSPMCYVSVPCLSVSLCVRVCMSVWAWRSIFSSCQTTNTPEYHPQSSICSTLQSSCCQIAQFPTVITCYGLFGASLNSSCCWCFLESCLTPVLQVHPLWCCMPALFGLSAVCYSTCRAALPACPTDQLISALFSRLFNKSSCLEHSPKTCLLSAFGST